MKAPGPGLLRFVHGVRKHGFLEFAGRQWREHGEVFQVRIGRRTLVFAMHPDAVERVSVGHRHSDDKLGSYDVVRRFLLGDGLVVSTDRWTREREAARHSHAYHPFAAGPRRRLGRRGDRECQGLTQIDLLTGCAFR